MDIYRRYGPALVRKATRLLGNQDDALDVVQGLFTDLFERGAVDVELPYLYRALTNRCLTMIRNRNTRARLLHRETPSLRGVVRTRCDEQVLGQDLLLKLMERLDESTLEVLVYRFWDDLDQTEIANVMGVSRKTVVRRMATLRAELVTLGALNAETAQREQAQEQAQAEAASAAGAAP
jgi:RNA polymerase sigma-70 factor (ECF subfamily)